MSLPPILVSHPRQKGRDAAGITISRVPVAGRLGQGKTGCLDNVGALKAFLALLFSETVN